MSLTSYFPRFKKLSLTLKCLIMQDKSPSKICLWVSEEDKARLPKDVVELVHKKFVEVHTSENLGPGTKILPALKHFPEYDIVTADDDIYYPSIWLQALIEHPKRGPKCVIAHRVHRVKFQSDGKLEPYDNWEQEAELSGHDKHYFATGVGGVLYPAKCFTGEVLNTTKYLQLCRNQDDVWLFFMSQLSGVNVVKSHYSFDLIPWMCTKAFGLNIDNCHGSNDVCISNMESEYGLLPNSLSENNTLKASND